MILYLIYGFSMVTCTVSPLSRFTAHLLPVYLIVRIFHFCVMKTFITDISASTGKNDFIFDIWLLHGELYRVYPFQVYRTSTSCLPCDLDFVTDISASTGINDIIFDIWLLHGELYRVYPFQVYCTSTSCLPCDLDFCNRYLSFYWKK
jgi:hypothetical protein